MAFLKAVLLLADLKVSYLDTSADIFFFLAHKTEWLLSLVVYTFAKQVKDS